MSGLQNDNIAAIITKFAKRYRFVYDVIVDIRSEGNKDVLDKAYSKTKKQPVNLFYKKSCS